MATEESRVLYLMTEGKLKKAIETILERVDKECETIVTGVYYKYAEKKTTINRQVLEEILKNELQSITE